VPDDIRLRDADPNVVIAGSAKTQATSPEPLPFQGVDIIEFDDLVVTAGFTGGPTLPGRWPATPLELSVMKVSSNVP